MSADQKIDRSCRQRVEHVGTFASALAACEQRHADPCRRGQRRDRVMVLARQDFGRRHQRGLAARLDHRGAG